MKTLILNGSPRPEGNTAYIINMIKNESTDVVNVYELDFRACINCGKCVYGKCIFNDGASDLINKIDEYDNIIMASPLYYNQPTGPLMSFMSRNQAIFNSRTQLKEKRGGIIVVGGGDTIVNSADAEKTMRIMLKSWNVNVIAYVKSLHTGKIPVWKDSIALEEAENMKRMIL